MRPPQGPRWWHRPVGARRSRLSRRQYRLLLVLAACHPVRLTARELLLAGGFWFPPWGPARQLLLEGWLLAERAEGSPHRAPPLVYSLTAAGRAALLFEMDRRIHLE